MQKHQELWERLKIELNRRLDHQKYTMWIAHLQSLDYSEEDRCLLIGVENVFLKDKISNNYIPLMNQIVREWDENWHVDLVIHSRQPQREIHTIPPAAAGNESLVADQGLNPAYVFSTFVVGRSNRLAHAASLGVCDVTAKNRYNPLFIWGGVGLGKTHLMHAIGHQVVAQNPAMKVCYLSAERFTNDLITAIKNNKTNEFRDRYRHIDLLLIDDIQFISGKESTQEEFFHTFNTLHNNKKQIVISSDRPPKDIQDIEDRLISRFEWGLVTDIQKPDLETRCAILKKKAEARDYLIPEKVIEFIATQVPSNIRELEGALNRVIANAELNGEKVTIENTTEWLKSALGTTRRGPLSILDIQQAVCDERGHSMEELISTKRTNDIALSRQIAMYLSRVMTDSSYKEICAAFNKKDHTTVIHAVRKIELYLKENTRIQSLVEKIKEKL